MAPSVSHENNLFFILTDTADKIPIAMYESFFERSDVIFKMKNQTESGG